MIELFGFNYWMWIGIAVFLAIIEVITFGSIFLLLIALSALIVGAIQWMFPSIAWQYQALLFCFMVISANIFIWQYAKRRPKTSSHNHLNQKDKQFLGKTYSLQEPIVNGRGKIKIGDTVWLVSGPDQNKGSVVRVIGMNGTILDVQPLSHSP